MTFVAIWSPKSQKNLSSLTKNMQLKITEKVKLVEENPFRYLEHFERENLYKIRFGDYRALIRVDFQEKVLLIEIFDKRGRVYKK